MKCVFSDTELASAWFRDTGTEAPIRLIGMAYEWNDEQGGNRTTYHLPAGVAEETAGL